MSTESLILIVDDSLIQRKIFFTILKTKGYSVIVAENGREGVDKALEHHPDLILMDISMPEMDGLKAVSEIRKHPEMSEIPILAMTATTDSEELEKAYQAGYTDSLNKSERATLLAKVQELLAR